MSKKGDWASIVVQQKPSRAVSTDHSRPNLRLGYIRHKNDGSSYLYCTDAYILARIPVHMDCKPEARASVLPEVGLPRETLEALDSASRFRFNGGFLEIEGRQARFPVDLATKSPDFKDILRRMQVDKPKAISGIAFAPANLARLIDALGADQTSVAFKFAARNQGIEVVPHLQSLGVGFLMPVRSS